MTEKKKRERRKDGRGRLPRGEKKDWAQERRKKEDIRNGRSQPP